jgi:hypothetical protein
MQSRYAEYMNVEAGIGTYGAAGKAICLEVNEGKRRLWTDFAEVILEGVAWFNVEDAFYN